MSDSESLEALNSRVLELNRIQGRLDTFIAGCSTGGNAAGADFIRSVKESLHVLEMTLQRDIERTEAYVTDTYNKYDDLAKELDLVTQERDQLKCQIDRMENNARRLKSIAGGRRG